MQGALPSGPGAELRAVLERQRALGVLGPAAVEDHLAQGSAVAEVVSTLGAPELIVELGSGGGVPGLIVASAFPSTNFVLIERRGRRAASLELAVSQLGWSGRVRVMEADAGDVARSSYRGTADVVLARSFGPPPVVVEYGLPLLRVGGDLVVTGRPEPTEWPVAALAAVGLGEMTWSSARGWNIGTCRSTRVADETLPRRGAIPRRRPLF